MRAIHRGTAVAQAKGVDVASEKVEALAESVHSGGDRRFFGGNRLRCSPFFSLGAVHPTMRYIGYLVLLRPDRLRQLPYYSVFRLGTPH